MALRFLSPMGLCSFYADESDDKFIYTIACVAIPSLVKHGLLNRNLAIAWDRYLGGAKEWRKNLREEFGVSTTQELKGSKIATGRNSYGPHGSRVHSGQAFDLYATALSSLSFLEKGSIFSVYATRGYEIFGHRKTEAALYALFQRMQKHCAGWIAMRSFSLTRATTSIDGCSVRLASTFPRDPSWVGGGTESHRRTNHSQRQSRTPISKTPSLPCSCK